MPRFRFIVTDTNDSGQEGNRGLLRVRYKSDGSIARRRRKAITTSPALYVDSPRALAGLADRLRQDLSHDARLAFDTEFIRERTYTPVFELLQVATLPQGMREPFIALVDVSALKSDLSPLRDLFLDPHIVKILHSGGQDIEIMTSVLGEMPRNVYDTQVGAAFAGYSLQTGYGALVQTLLNVRLNKEEGFADWSRRPLTPSMLDYAENDVRYLHRLHDRLEQLLQKRGRAAWAEEQTQRILNAAAQPSPVGELWRKVGGRNAFDRRQLAVLRELAIWRDEEARRRDKPRRTVIKDDALIEITRRLPKTANELLALRSAPQNLGERAADQIVNAVRRGLAVPEADRPVPDVPVSLDDQGAALVELLSAIVKVRAMEENLPPSLLASGDDLRYLAAASRAGTEIESVEVLQGWRNDLIGDDLRAALAGTLSMSWNPRERRMQVTRHAP